MLVKRLRSEIEMWGQFHQRSTGSFCASRFTLNLLAYSVLSLVYFQDERNGEVGRNFVGETEQRQKIPPGAFALCARGLVKLTPKKLFSAS